MSADAFFLSCLQLPEVAEESECQGGDPDAHTAGVRARPGQRGASSRTIGCSSGSADSSTASIE